MSGSGLVRSHSLGPMRKFLGRAGLQRAGLFDAPLVARQFLTAIGVN
jgi:hypothetical protein